MAVEDEIMRRRGIETRYGDTTREQILETRNRRKRQLRVMMMDARKQLADHSAGEKTLTAELKEQLENKVDIFQRKIDSMEVDLEEWVSAHLISEKMHSKQNSIFDDCISNLLLLLSLLLW